jgi:hypothetical protein
MRCWSIRRNIGTNKQQNVFCVRHKKTTKCHTVIDSRQIYIYIDKITPMVLYLIFLFNNNYLTDIFPIYVSEHIGSILLVSDACRTQFITIFWISALHIVVYISIAGYQLLYDILLLFFCLFDTEDIFVVCMCPYFFW